MELKELFTVLSFFKIDAAFFHFSLFLFLDFGTNRHHILGKTCRGQTFPHLIDLVYQQSHIYSL